MVPTVKRLEIRGAVQGVGFRWAMAEQARRFNICGWVRNRHDGSVEAVVSGAPEDVDRIVAWARRGPDAALVRSIEVLAAEGAFDTFEQQPTT